MCTMHYVCYCYVSALLFRQRLYSKTHRCHCSNSRLLNFLLFFLFEHHYNLALGFFFCSSFVALCAVRIFEQLVFRSHLIIEYPSQTIDACQARNVETNAGVFVFFFFLLSLCLQCVEIYHKLFERQRHPKCVAIPFMSISFS